jgi:hypothetical protein
MVLRGQDLNLRPSGYEPDELPNCSTPRRYKIIEFPLSNCASRRTTPTSVCLFKLLLSRCADVYAPKIIRSCSTPRRYKLKELWRRKGDSNPRGLLHPCRFSRPIPSAGLGYSSVIKWYLVDLVGLEPTTGRL